MDYLRTSGHADGSRERKSTGNIRNLWLLVDFIRFYLRRLTLTVDCMWSGPPWRFAQTLFDPLRIDVVKIALRVLYVEKSKTKILEFLHLMLIPIRVCFFLRHITRYFDGKSFRDSFAGTQSR